MSANSTNDIDNIMNYLLKKDSEVKMDRSHIGYDIDVPEQFLEDAWPSSPDELLLDNIFSLEGGPLLEDPEPQGNLTPSDSGLSMDHSDFDMLSLSPLLQEDYEGGEGDNLLQPLPLPSPLPSPLSSISPSPPPPATLPPQLPLIHITDKQQTIAKDSTNNITLKRKCPVTTTNILSSPKIQKHYIARRDSTSSSASSTTSTNSGGPPRVVICSSPSAIKQQTPRKVIRVTPMQGNISNPRSILLPVTLKDMKELKTIKIINASDLKNSASIKIAAANFLQQSKQIVREPPKNKIIYTTAAGYDTDDSRYVMEECGSSSRSEEEADHEDDESHEEDSHGDGKQFPKLKLTAEERRLLQREGVTLPDRYPLTRGEERELKRIRRKIRNKISAQDSRRRKKEYVDGLEDRVKQCTDENQTLMKRIKELQSQNNSLSAKLKKLQSIMSGGSVGSVKTAPPATCLMVLLLSMALVVAPNLRPSAPPPQHTSAPAAPATHLSPAAHSHFVSSIRRALLSMKATQPMTPMEEVIEEEVPMDEMVLGDHTYNLPSIHPVGKISSKIPLYMDLPLDGDSLLKVEKIDYDSDYGGSIGSITEAATMSTDWMTPQEMDMRVITQVTSNRNFSASRSIVVKANEELPNPSIR